MNVIFKQFAVVPWKFNSLQIKQDLLSSVINLVHELALEFPNNLKQKILGNKEIISKFVRDTGQYPVSSPEINCL